MEIPHKGIFGTILLAATAATVVGAQWVSGHAGITQEQSLIRACIVFPYSMIISSRIIPSMAALTLSVVEFQVYAFAIYFTFMRDWTWRVIFALLMVHGIATLISLLIRR